MRGQNRVRADGGAERAVQGVGRELRRVALGRAQPAELACDLLRADLRRLQQRRAAHEADDGAAGRDACAAAARVEAGVRDPPAGAVAVERERDPDQIAARGASGGAGVGVRGDVAAAERGFEVLGKCLGTVHPSEFRVPAERDSRSMKTAVGKTGDYRGTATVTDTAWPYRLPLRFLAGFVDRLLDREGIGQAVDRRHRTAFVDDEDRRRAVDLDGLCERAEGRNLAG